MSTPYRDHPGLQDYYETVPPAHRLSDYNSFSNSTSDIPLADTGRNHYQNAPYGNTAGYQDSTAHFNSYHDLSEPPPAPNDNWMEKSGGGATRSGTGGGGHKKAWIIGGVILAILIAVGVAVGVVVSRNNNSSSGSSSSQDSVTNSDPNDPSSFEKDSNLRQSFYGIAYTPEGSQLPDCGNSLENVITDIQLMSQITTRVRLYGADCNQSALVLEAIRQTKTDISVWLGNYPAVDDGGEAYVRQRDLIVDAIETYGTDHIEGITVGNEFMLNYLNSQGESDPNGAVGNAGAQLLITNITDMRTTIEGMNLDKTIQIGNADAGSYFNDFILEQVDYGLSNVHPWFGNVRIDDAAGWTYEFFQTNNVDQANALSNQPEMYIAETGWPTKSSDASSESNGPSTASVPNLQIFLDTFVCQATANDTKYFFFEFFDEKWKDERYGGVEGWWGLFNANRTLKEGITIPTC